VIRNRLVVKMGVGNNFTIKVRLESQAANKSQPNKKPQDDDFAVTNRIFEMDKETMDFLRDQL